MFKKAVTKGIFKRMVSMMMALVMGVAMVPEAVEPIKAEAAYEKTVDGLGTSIIKAPTAGKLNTNWTGSYVWYGKYDTKPVRYRVLSPWTDKFGSNTMFLDCDYVLYKRLFNEYWTAAGNDGGYTNFDREQNCWRKGIDPDNLNNDRDCPLKTSLNSNTGADGFYERSGVFTDMEKVAITPSYDNSAGAAEELTGERVFVLTKSDIANTSYGYGAIGSIDAGGSCLIKKSIETGIVDMAWWTRTGSPTPWDLENGYIKCQAFIVTPYGADERVIWEQYGVCPAFNLSLSSILFASAVSGEAGKDDAEYKLTLQDNDIILGAGATSAEGSKVSVKYTLGGSHASDVNRVSVLIIDKKFKKENKSDAKVLYYGKLDIPGGAISGGAGSFDFPEELNKGGWGTDYFVYLVAEQENAQHETDYAGVPVELIKPETFSHEYAVKITTEGNGSASAAPVKGYPGTEVALTATADKAWSFKEWQVISGDVTINNNRFTLGEKDVEIKAVFEHTGVPCEGVTVSKNLVLKTGESVSLNAVIAPDDARDRTVSWKSDNDAVVKVDETGKVTGVSNGYATVTATTKDGGFTAQCEVMVTPESIDDNDARTGISPDDLKTYVIPKKEDKTVTAKEINLGSKKAPDKVDVSISMNCYNAVTYTGKAATPKNDPDGFRFTADLSGVLAAADIINAKSEDLLSVSFVGKSKNAGSGEFYAKISLLPKSKRKADITSQQQKVLKKIISAVNKELKKKDNRIKFTINKASILTLEPIEVHAKLDKDGKIKYDGEVLKGVKSVKGKLKAADTKAKKIAKSNYKLTVVKAETNSVKVSGAGKNYTGWTTVTATK